MTGRIDFQRDDRAVSITVTHVLTIAITAVLISGLMFGAGTLLQNERERGAQQSLETIGERLSGEIASVDRVANDSSSESANVSLDVTHPRQVSGSAYTVDLTTDCSSPLLNKTDVCVVLTSQGDDVEEQVPVTVSPDRIDDSGGSVYGGAMTIVYDATADEIRLERGHQ